MIGEQYSDVIVPLAEEKKYIPSVCLRYDDSSLTEEEKNVNAEKHKIYYESLTEEEKKTHDSLKNFAINYNFLRLMNHIGHQNGTCLLHTVDLMCPTVDLLCPIVDSELTATN